MKNKRLKKKEEKMYLFFSCFKIKLWKSSETGLAEKVLYFFFYFQKAGKRSEATFK